MNLRTQNSAKWRIPRANYTLGGFQNAQDRFHTPLPSRETAKRRPIFFPSSHAHSSALLGPLTTNRGIGKVVLEHSESPRGCSNPFLSPALHFPVAHALGVAMLQVPVRPELAPVDVLVRVRAKAEADGLQHPRPSSEPASATRARSSLLLARIEACVQLGRNHELWELSGEPAQRVLVFDPRDLLLLLGSRCSPRSRSPQDSG